VIDKESLILSLHEIGAVQLNEASAHSGGRSPLHVDLQALASRPATLRRVAHIMQAHAAHLTFDRLAAIPMGGLAIGVALSLTMDRPLIYPRPLGNESNAGRLIAGSYKAGETALLIDDLIGDGSSQLETLGLLKMVRLRVTDVLVVLDRGLGGKEALESQEYRVHAILTTQEVLDTLLQLHRISPEQHKFVSAWIAEARSRRKGQEPAQAKPQPPAPPQPPTPLAPPVKPPDSLVAGTPKPASTPSTTDKPTRKS
jgi:orotate phosphoribosyltransferase